VRRTYQITGLVFVLLAAFLGYQAAALRYYTSLGPGPGFFPLWLCGLLGVLGVIVALQATFAPAAPLPADFFPSRTGAVRIAAVLVALFAVAFAIRGLGFRLTMLPFFAVLLSTLGRRHPLETAVLSVAGSFGIYYLFTELLSLPLPVGTFGI
jgi:putative tricarboxylic transport membrane protein